MTEEYQGGTVLAALEPRGPDLLDLTAAVVAAHVGNNQVPPSAVGELIGTVHAAFVALGKPPVPVLEDGRKEGAVSERASIKPDHLVSMIDGKPYKMLRRHITQHGYTPETYRSTFGLKADYPMVAAAYAEQRRELAHKIGLGRKSGNASAQKA